jgi:hypothetical protein
VHLALTFPDKGFYLHGNTPGYLALQVEYLGLLDSETLEGQYRAHQQQWANSQSHKDHC